MALGYDVKMKERRLAIVLLDLIGSTAFVQKYGAQKSALHFQVHDRLTRSLLFKFRGREIDRSDGFLCSFENVIDAVNFALHYQKKIPPKTKLGCRIGIHWDTIIEVHQDDVWVAANAKRIELEGLAKNIAARTMSLCGEGQVLLTAEAMEVARHRTNLDTPKGTRYVCVGKYKFKGVKKPQTIYAVGETLESLQPPKGSEKVKRVTGPKKVKLKFSQMKFLEIVEWFFWRIGWATFILLFCFFYWVISSPEGRYILGLESLAWVDDVNRFISPMWELCKKIIPRVVK